MTKTKIILLATIFCFTLTSSRLLGLSQSSQNYVSSLDTSGWVVTEAQMRAAICEQQNPVQLPIKELTNKRCFFLVKLHNLQGYRAWGTLEVSSPGNFSTEFRVRDIAPHLNANEYFVIPLGVTIFPESEYDQKPKVCFKWKKLSLR